jgi:hypothetical protein
MSTLQKQNRRTFFKRTDQRINFENFSKEFKNGRTTKAGDYF